MVSEMMIDELKNSIGKMIIYFNQLGMRFEGKILRVDTEYLKYYDTYKLKERFIKLEEIKEFEIEVVNG